VAGRRTERNASNGRDRPFAAQPEGFVMKNSVTAMLQDIATNPLIERATQRRASLLLWLLGHPTLFRNAL
jgi:hypothetical protein